jgi:antitoxin component YwqK of YwqJK toxin-antitoxin module
MRLLTLLILVFTIPYGTHAAPVYPAPDTLFNQTDNHGLKHGPWKVLYNDSIVKYRGSFNHGQPQGIFKRYYDDGTIRAIMDYQPDGKTVKANLFYNNGQLAAVGDYVSMNKHGVWKYYSYYTNALSSEENYIAGKKNGLLVRYYDKGNKSEELEYVNDAGHGKWFRYYENGSVYLQGNFINGQRDGDFVVYYPGGRQQIKGKFLMGKMEGDWTYYSAEGKTEMVISYINGIPQNTDQLDEKQEEFFKMIDGTKGKYPEPDETNFAPGL